MIIECQSAVVCLEFLRFWKFSRNRLAGDESPPGGSSVYSSLGVLGGELPGGTFPAARRRLELHWISGLRMKRLAVLVEPPGSAGPFFLFWGFLEF